jgi:hypothetical protein
MNIKIEHTIDPQIEHQYQMIQCYFEDVVSFLFKYSPKHPSCKSNVRVYHGSTGPQLRFEGNSIKGFEIDLNTQVNDLGENVFQFSHEACHILAQALISQYGHHNQWFEECICETASLCVLNSFSEIDDQEEGSCVKKYANGISNSSIFEDSLRRNRPEQQMKNGIVNLKAWFKDNESELRRDPNRRDLHHPVNLNLFSMLKQRPDNWGAVEFLNKVACTAGHDSFNEYLSNWNTASSGKFEAFINQIRDLLI